MQMLAQTLKLVRGRDEQREKTSKDCFKCGKPEHIQKEYHINKVSHPRKQDTRSSSPECDPVVAEASTGQ